MSITLIINQSRMRHYCCKTIVDLSLDVNMELSKLNISDKLQIILVLSTTTLVPLAILPAASDQCLSIKYFLLKTIVVFIAGVFAIRALKSGIQFRRSGLETAVAVFIGLIVIATLLSKFHYTSLEGAYTRYDGFYSYLIYIGLFFVAVHTLSNDSIRKSFLTLSIATGTILSIYGIAQAAGLDPMPWGYKVFESTRSFATFGNPILLAPYLSILLPISIGFLFDAKTRLQKVAYAIASLLIGTCLITTMSRAAWIAVFIGIILQFVILAKSKRINIGKIILPIVIAVASTGFLVIALTGVDTITSRASSIISLDQSFANRLSMWDSAVRIVEDNPLFGCGPDAIAFTYPKYEMMDMTLIAPNEVQDNVHNIYLQLAATCGIPALLAFLAVIILLFIKTIRFLRVAGTDRLLTVSPIVSGLIGGITAYLIQGFTGLSGIETSTYLWLFMGVLASYWAKEKQVPSISRSIVFRRLMEAAVIMVVALVIYKASSVFAGDYLLGKARFAEGNGNIKTAVKLYRRAADYNRGDEKALRELGILLADVGRTANERNTWSMGVDYLEDAASKNYGNHKSVLTLGQGYLYGAKVFDKKYYKLSETNLKKALELRPNAPLALAMLGVVYYDTGRTKQAGESLAKALYINPKDPQAHYYYGQCFEKMGKRDKAKRQYAMTLKIDASHEKARLAYDKLANQEQ
jgi:putative inorganic carbon (HCO3(-)) transporter